MAVPTDQVIFPPVPKGSTVYTQVELLPLIPPYPSYSVHTSRITPLNPPLERGETGDPVPSPFQGEG
jgi:hypothetical protein